MTKFKLLRITLVAEVSHETVACMLYRHTLRSVIFVSGQVQHWDGGALILD